MYLFVMHVDVVSEVLLSTTDGLFFPFETQIQNLESEILEKRKQMRVLEQRIIESGEASMANASLVDMQQVVMFSSLLSIFLLIKLLAGISFSLFGISFSLFGELTLFFSPKQTVTRLIAQCNEKGFELEVNSLHCILFIYLSLLVRYVEIKE